MDILGIGPLELIVILIVALVVFGPDKLPTIGAKLGHAMRDMRRATRAFSQELDQARQAIDGVKEAAEPFREVAGAAKAATELMQTARNPGLALRDSVMRELGRTDEPAASQGATPTATTEPEPRIVPPDLAAQAAAEPADTALEPMDSESIVAGPALAESETAPAAPPPATPPAPDSGIDPEI